MGLEPKSAILVVEKLFLADDNPVILACNYIPTNITQRAYTDDDFHLPLYQFLSDFCQQEMTYYFSEIISAAVTSTLRKKLDLPTLKKSLLSFEELSFNQDNALSSRHVLTFGMMYSVCVLFGVGFNRTLRCLLSEIAR